MDLVKGAAVAAPFFFDPYFPFFGGFASFLAFFFGMASSCGFSFSRLR